MNLSQNIQDKESKDGLWEGFEDGSHIIEDNESKDGLLESWEDNLLLRFRNHVTACIVLTMLPEAIPGMDLDITGRYELLIHAAESGTGGSIGGLRSGPRGPSRWGGVSSRSCPHFAPEFLTCRSISNLALHSTPKHLILYQLMLLRFFT